VFLRRICVLNDKSGSGEEIVGCRLLGSSGTDTNRACGQARREND
jgi:hypothetical protein